MPQRSHGNRTNAPNSQGQALSAVDVLQAPPSRAAQLARARATARRWIDAVAHAERGPLWDVLSRACDEAEILGLGDHSFLTFVKNAKRYLAYLAANQIPQSHAFKLATVRAYQLHVARLAKRVNVPPVQEGKSNTYKTKPQPREAQDHEPRLEIKTQKNLLDAVRLLYLAAVAQEVAATFDEFPDASPTLKLKWRDEEERDPVRIELDLKAMLNKAFVPAKGRSRCDFERNLLFAHLYAAIESRNTELREAVWEGLQVWQIAPGARLPLRRWPIEALLCHEVALDETHQLFLTLGGAVPTKSDTYRSVPLVGALAQRVVAYAHLWLADQLANLVYLRYRSRKALSGQPDLATTDLRTVALLIGGVRVSVASFGSDAALFKRVGQLTGPGRVRVAGSGDIIELETDEARAVRDLLWAEVARHRYAAAIAAFAHKTPIRDVFSGVFLPSREGGVLCDKQVQHIWRDMGWTNLGWTPQHLRAHAAQLYRDYTLGVLRPLAHIIGHKEPSTTRLNYTGATPYEDVVVAEIIAKELGV